MSATRDRPTVLALLAVFWPGNDATGPNQSFRAMAEGLAADFMFRAVARDRGYGASVSERPTGQWFDRDGLPVRYAAMGPWGASDLGAILRTTPHDVLMLNGFYDRDFTLPALMLRQLGRVPRRPTILSPRGEFAAGAASLKAGRKRAWCQTARRLGLLADVWLHATSEAEAADIRAGFPWSRGVLVAPNIRALVEPQPRAPAPSGVTRLAFVGRVSPVKNLDYALAALASVRVPLDVRIFGPCPDQVYAEACRKIAAQLPRNVSVSFEGEVANEQVPRILAETDLFYLPTKGENFGHAIFEALSCGVPALISDTTPWRGLEALGAGWDLPLDEPADFARKIEAFASLGDHARARMRVQARALAERWILHGDAVARTRAMLAHVLGQASVAMVPDAHPDAVSGGARPT